jgi:hypothetical protein
VSARHEEPAPAANSARAKRTQSHFRTQCSARSCRRCLCFRSTPRPLAPGSWPPARCPRSRRAKRTQSHFRTLKS